MRLEHLPWLLLCRLLDQQINPPLFSEHHLLAQLLWRCFGEMLPPGAARGRHIVLNRAGSSFWVQAPASRTGLGHSWLWVYQGLRGPGIPKAWLEDFTVCRILAAHSTGTAGLNVPTMLPGGSRVRMQLGPVGQPKLVCIPSLLGPGGSHWDLGMLHTLS